MADGPQDPGLWLTRKAGCWESLMYEAMDHTFNANIVLNTWIKADFIDPAKIEQAYRALIYNQPNLRADVRKDEDGTIYFVPATDFSDVFEFVDQSECGNSGGYAGCWSLAEELADRPFSFGSGAPLNKCYLIKRPDGYNLLNKLHHGIADGTTSFRVLNEVLRQYDLLISGKEVDLMPAKVLPSAEEQSLFAKNDEVVKKMVQSKLERARSQQVLFPLNQEEVAASRSQIPFKNRTLHAMGTGEGFLKLRAICKELGVKIGSYSFAVLALAEAAVYIRRHGNQIPEDGIPTIYTDVVADLRSRLVPNPGECFMFLISEIEAKSTIDRETRLFDLAKDITKQLEISFEDDGAPLFYSCKEEMETGEHSDFFSSIPEGTKSEFMASNKLVLKNPIKYNWGEVKSTHTIGSYWCPVVSNQMVLYHCVGGTMCYSIVCCDGADNIRDAKEVFDLFVHVIEHSDLVNEETGVMDLVDLRSKK